MIKTFRGLLADGGQERIRLSTIKGKVGYKIVKFRIFSALPSTADASNTVMIWKEEQSSVSASTATVNFTDSNLLGVASILRDEAETDVIFDNEIFNQDIYVTHTDVTASRNCNYYIELEIIPLDDAGAEYTTLKDMRQG